MDLFHGFGDDEVGDSSRMLSSTPLFSSLLVVDKIDEEKVNENILIEDSDSDKIDDSDTGGSELYLVSVDNNNLGIKDEMYDVGKLCQPTTFRRS